MLALTEDAVSAVNTILASSELPEGSGMRIAAAPPSEDSAEPGELLQMSVVPGPEDGDQVVGEQPVFLDPAAADVLDGKLLDAEIVENQVRFSVGEQA